MPDDASIQRTVQQLLDEVRTARNSILEADEKRAATFDELRKLTEFKGKPVPQALADLEAFNAAMNARVAKTMTAVETLSKRLNRPGGGVDLDDDDRGSAIKLLEQKNALRTLKANPQRPYLPDETEIAEAQLAIKSMRHLLKADLDTLPPDARKALSSFALGSSGFILPPEMSSQILSCLIDQTDIAALMQNVSISGSSIKFMVDNSQLDLATWACDSSCFGQTEIRGLLDGLGELEIKPESIRYIVCAHRDFVEDADINVELWLTNKISRAIRATVSDAILKGDGIGKPLGILHPTAALPIVETGAGTPASQFSWQDPVMLKYSIPMQYHARGRYFMNQLSFALALTMSDAMGRPIMISSPTEDGQWRICGSPVSIVTQMPDVAPGATPVTFGDWQSAYTVVNRKAVTMQQDPYSAGFCILYKVEARVGGSVTCPNAARLLRIR